MGRPSKSVVRLQQMKQCGTPIAKIPAPKPTLKENQQAQQETYTDELPPNFAGSEAIANIYYAISVDNSYGRSAGLSNQAQVPAAPTLAPPANFQARLAPDGVKLSWNTIPNPLNIPNLRFAYRIYRREAGTQSDAVAGEVPVENESAPSFVDHGFEWEKTYDYRAQCNQNRPKRVVASSRLRVTTLRRSASWRTTCSPRQRQPAYKLYSRGRGKSCSSIWCGRRTTRLIWQATTFTVEKRVHR